jgi:hypothetical protein
MRFITILSALSVFASGVSAVAAPNTSLAMKSALLNINAGNCWGAPIPPWEDNCHPGWYYGRKEYAPTGLLCLVDDVR